MIWLFSGTAVVLLLWVLIKFLSEGDPAVMARFVKTTGAAIFALAAILFVVMGRVSMALLFGGAAATLLGLPDRFFGRRGNGSSQGGEHSQGQTKAPTSAMSRAEAYEVLGLKSGASEPKIREAHRRLIKQSHPDQGGSDYLAAKVNLAKDVLLGKN